MNSSALKDRRAGALAQHAGLRAARPVVCHVVHSLNVGGAELLAAGIATELSDTYRGVFACLDGLGELATQLDDDLPYVNLARGRGWDFGCGQRLACWFKQNDVDLVHAHQTTPFIYSLLARGLAKRPQILFTEHGRFLPDVPSWKRRLLMRSLMRRTDRVVAVGEAVREALVRVERLRANRIGVIYNGVSVSSGCLNDGERRRIRGALQTPDGACVLMLTARLDPIKNHSLALEACQRVISIRPDVRLWLVGDGPERATIESIIEKKSLRRHVQLLGQRRDVPTLLAAADVALLSSHSEGIPLTLIEAMAAGLPIVSTDVGGVRELIQHNKQGLLVPAGDVRSLADCLLSLVDSRAERTRLGSGGRMRAETFSAERMLGKYQALYDEMLSEK